ncbi:DUF1801 domain-containing protein [Fertoebacter nigrum]|uniref:DUF1801 domain-containing protein n=1 Tax=Fertoeibacter niger TaxID=2656921 RepID=A0A8X8KQ17_9RHOB|nr:DUF1801 domain-containing protein [Fertoeibacter niger]NUB46700.1 DUF1801 domain-containing protein [Fertoeibacter niger]
MGTLKTTASEESLADFLARVPDVPRRDEAARLAAIFADATGFAPRIWGGTMVGYGRYAYRTANGRIEEYFATGFAPRKAELVIYILPGYAGFGALLAALGPHRKGKSCLYLRRLAGVDEAVLARLIRAGLEDLATRATILPH